jgi:hypothetical protein
MRRRRGARYLDGSPLTDEYGRPITFAKPGQSTTEERRQYALAV